MLNFSAHQILFNQERQSFPCPLVLYILEVPLQTKGGRPFLFSESWEADHKNAYFNGGCILIFMVENYVKIQSQYIILSEISEMTLLLWALLSITFFLLIIFWLEILVIFYRVGRTTTSLWYYIDRLAIRPRERKDILALVNMYFLLYLGRPTSNGGRPFISDFWQAYVLLFTS